MQCTMGQVTTSCRIALWPITDATWVSYCIALWGIFASRIALWDSAEQCIMGHVTTSCSIGLWEDVAMYHG